MCPYGPAESAALYASIAIAALSFPAKTALGRGVARCVAVGCAGVLLSVALS